MPITRVRKASSNPGDDLAQAVHDIEKRHGVIVQIVSAANEWLIITAAKSSRPRKETRG